LGFVVVCREEGGRGVGFEVLGLVLVVGGFGAAEEMYLEGGGGWEGRTSGAELGATGWSGRWLGVVKRAGAVCRGGGVWCGGGVGAGGRPPRLPPPSPAARRRYGSRAGECQRLSK